jgi:NAD kinase
MRRLVAYSWRKGRKGTLASREMNLAYFAPLLQSGNFPFFFFVQPTNSDRHVSTRRAVDPGDVDLAIVLGGDGTLLHASSLFASPASEIGGEGMDACPPMVPVGLGTISALLPFSWPEAERLVARIAAQGYAEVHGLSRLSCEMEVRWRICFFFLVF